MSGRRLRYTLIGLVILAALAVAVVVTTGDDEDDADTAGDGSGATATTVGEAASDEDLTVALLPPISALGPDWIDTQRDDRATPVEPTVSGTCPAGPVPEGFLARNEQHHTRGQQIVESLSVTVGVVTPGVEPPSLDDPAIVVCLGDGLQTQLGEGATIATVEDVTIGPANPGALVSHHRFEVTGEAAVGGTFDFVLVQRGRGVSLGLLTGTDPSQRTELAALIAVLDRPLNAIADQLG